MPAIYRLSEKPECPELCQCGSREDERDGDKNKESRISKTNDNELISDRDVKYKTVRQTENSRKDEENGKISVWLRMYETACYKCG